MSRECKHEFAQLSYHTGKEWIPTVIRVCTKCPTIKTLWYISVIKGETM